ncbi:MAG: hypothetical protein ACRD88_03515 [Terriglobia bacterium]
MTSWFLLLLGLAVGIAVALFLNPIAVTVDTNRGVLEARWTALLRVQWPLGQDGGARWFLAGMPFPLPRIGRERPGREPRERKPRSAGLQFSRLFRFLRFCASDSALRRAIVVQGGKLARGAVRSFELSHWHAEFSFADPAVNGMLAGWLAATRWAGQSPVGVNFLGRNWLALEVRLYPYRLAMAGTVFLVQIPHRAILRQWLASKT